MSSVCVCVCMVSHYTCMYGVILVTRSLAGMLGWCLLLANTKLKLNFFQ